MVNPKVEAVMNAVQAMATSKAAKRMTSAHLDDWQNSVTGLGDWSRDKRYGAIPFVTSLDYETATDLYRASRTCQIAVDVFADEMTREWADVIVPEDEEASEGAGDELERLKFQGKMNQMIKWQRLYGGAAVLVGVNDGSEDFSTPINEDKLKSIDFLTVFDPSECRVIEWQASPADNEYGEPLYYSIFPRIFGMGAATILQKVHASRVIRLNGPLANRWQVAVRAGWGDSVLDNVWTACRDFDAAHAGAASLVSDWGQGVFLIKGLAEAMASDNEALVSARLKMIDYSRSLLRSIALDADEDFKRETTPASGLDKMLEKVAAYLAMQLSMPVTVLMGESPAGLNATGDNEVKMWFNTLHAKQERELSPVMLKLLRLIFLQKGGNSPTGGKLPEAFNLDWRNLSQPSQAEEATTNYQQAQADALNIQNGIVSADEIRMSRFKGGKFSTQTQLDESLDVEDSGDLAQTDAEAERGGAGQPVLEGATLSGPSAGGAPAKTDKVANMKSETTTDPATAADKKPSAQQTPPTNKRANLAAQTPAATGPKATDQGMAGHQVSAAHDVIKSGATGQIPLDAVLNMLVHMLGMDPAAAQAIVDSLKGFKPKPDPVKTQELAIKAKGLNVNKNKTASPKAKKGTGG